MALIRRHGIRPYRYYRQRHTTVMARISQELLDETLWPEFVALNRALQEHLDIFTEEIIREAVHQDVSDVVEIRGTLHD